MEQCLRGKLESHQKLLKDEGVAVFVWFGSHNKLTVTASCRANGRLAMIAVIAAVAAELSTGTSKRKQVLGLLVQCSLPFRWLKTSPCYAGKSVLSQLKIEPTLISLTFLIISAATFIPFSKNVDPEEKEGIFTPFAEVINGRAASKLFIRYQIQ